MFVEKLFKILCTLPSNYFKLLPKRLKNSDCKNGKGNNDTKPRKKSNHRRSAIKIKKDFFKVSDFINALNNEPSWQKIVDYQNDFKDAQLNSSSEKLETCHDMSKLMKELKEASAKDKTRNNSRLIVRDLNNSKQLFHTQTVDLEDNDSKIKRLTLRLFTLDISGVKMSGATNSIKLCQQQSYPRPISDDKKCNNFFKSFSPIGEIFDSSIENLKVDENFNDIITIHTSQIFPSLRKHLQGTFDPTELEPESFMYTLNFDTDTSSSKNKSENLTNSSMETNENKNSLVKDDLKISVELAVPFNKELNFFSGQDDNVLDNFSNESQFSSSNPSQEPNSNNSNSDEKPKTNSFKTLNTPTGLINPSFAELLKFKDEFMFKHSKINTEKYFNTNAKPSEKFPETFIGIITLTPKKPLMKEPLLEDYTLRNVNSYLEKHNSTESAENISNFVEKINNNIFMTVKSVSKLNHELKDPNEKISVYPSLQHVSSVLKHPPQNNPSPNQFLTQMKSSIVLIQKTQTQKSQLKKTDTLKMQDSPDSFQLSQVRQKSNESPPSKEQKVPVSSNNSEVQSIESKPDESVKEAQPSNVKLEAINNKIYIEPWQHIEDIKKNNNVLEYQYSKEKDLTSQNIFMSDIQVEKPKLETATANPLPNLNSLSNTKSVTEVAEVISEDQQQKPELAVTEIQTSSNKSGSDLKDTDWGILLSNQNSQQTVALQKSLNNDKPQLSHAPFSSSSSEKTSLKQPKSEDSQIHSPLKEINLIGDRLQEIAKHLEKPKQTSETSLENLNEQQNVTANVLSSVPKETSEPLSVKLPQKTQETILSNYASLSKTDKIDSNNIKTPFEDQPKPEINETEKETEASVNEPLNLLNQLGQKHGREKSLSEPNTPQILTSEPQTTMAHNATSGDSSPRNKHNIKTQFPAGQVESVAPKSKEEHHPKPKFEIDSKNVSALYPETFQKKNLIEEPKSPAHTKYEIPESNRNLESKNENLVMIKTQNIFPVFVEKELIDNELNSKQTTPNIKHKNVHSANRNKRTLNNTYKHFSIFRAYWKDVPIENEKSLHKVPVENEALERFQEMINNNLFSLSKPTNVQTKNNINSTSNLETTLNKDPIAMKEYKGPQRNLTIRQKPSLFCRIKQYCYAYEDLKKKNW